ncbi:MAG TPA: ATP-binding protein [Thermoanaerobaculia bacterium]|jgi:two-component system nitrogen regulation sensor histidine kinase NtrY
MDGGERPLTESVPPVPPYRWTRDNRILLAIGLALGAAFAGGYALVLRTRDLTAAAATNRVLIFVLFYIVVVLILVLLFVLVRNGIKLVLESRRGVFGSRFRARVVAAYVGLALLPISLLILPTTGLLQKSVERWFAPPVENTIRAGRQVADLVRARTAALERRTADRLLPRLAVSPEKDLVALLSSAREESGVDYLEWRRAGGPPVAVSSPRWPVREVADAGADWLADAKARGVSRRIEATHDGGQTERSLFASPSGTLLIGTFEPPAEAEPIRELGRATSAYAMLKAERSSLEAIQILLFLLLAFVVLLAAVWVGLLLARRVTRPIGALAASARRVGAGDFDALVEVEGGDEIGALSRAFNSMTSELRRRRAELVAANAELEATNQQLDEQRQRFGSILARLDAGVIAFWEDGRLAFLNDTARRLLDREAAGAVERIDDLLAPAPLAPLRDFLARARGAGPREETLKIGRRVLEAHLAQAPAGSGGAGPSIVTLEDTTALVAAERAAAWEEAARRMAHEIKNPLTPIRLAAERMRRRAASSADSGDGLPRVVEEGASTIVQEVTALSALVDTFQRFARLPAAVLAPTDLGAVVAQVAKLYDGVKRGIAVTAEAADGLGLARADAGQLRRALINLVDNAVAAAPEGGHVRVAVRVAEGRAVVSVEDDGPGIAAADRERVFDQDYSTKGRGSGLGLAIVARIAAEHGGTVRVEENAPHGCRFLLEWPAA